MNKFFLQVVILLLAGLWTSLGFAQHRIRLVTGVIVSNIDGSPVDNATIRIEGIKRSYVSDKDGKFSIPLPNKKEAYTFYVRKLGFLTIEREVVLHSDLRALTIRMSPSENMLEEVIISTGYQQLPKERATGSFEVVNEKLFNRQIGADVISRLDGIMPGIFFDKRAGDEKNMIVRGVASLGLTDSKPLIILDNFPFEGDINSINPNDVENVTLLKDAAAASIWGAKAGNGVLVITTKRGRYNSPWSFSLVANTSITERPDLFYLPQISSKEFIDVERFLFEKGVFNSTLNNSSSRPPVTPVVELLNRHSKSEISDAELEAQLDELSKVDLRDQLTNYFYRIGVNQQYSTTLSGGGEKYSALVSLGYDQNNHTSVGSDFSRLNLNIQNSFRPLSKLQLNVGVKFSSLSTGNNQISNLQMLNGRNLYPYARLVDDSGQALAVEKDYRSLYLDEVEQRGTLLDWRYRPYEELKLNDHRISTNNILFNGRVGYDLLKGLTAELYYQYEYQPTTDRQHFSPDSYYARNMINRFTQITDDEVIRPVPPGGVLDRNLSYLTAHSVRGQLNFNRSWKQNSLIAIGGMEVRHSETEGNSNRLYGYNDDILTSGLVDYVTRFPIYDDLGFKSSILYPNRGFGSVQRFVSLYANAAYTFDDRYTLSASARRDASNLFGVETNDKWTPLWSIGGSWNLAKEKFFVMDALPILKIRGTYGFSGNVSNGQAAVTTLEYRGNSRVGRFPYAVIKNPPNPNLRWEKIESLNLGLEFGLRNNRLNGSIEFYRKTATDLLSIVNADPTTGFSFLTLNSAIVRNAGVDFSLHGNASIGQLKWSGDLMLSANKNRVVQYLWEVTNPSQWVGGGVSVSPIEGQPAYPVVSYKFAGLDPENGDPLGYLNEQKSSDYAALTRQASMDDLLFHGSALPELYGGIRNTFTWRGMSISANLTYRGRYYFRRETVNYSTLLTVNGIASHGDFTDRWQKPGDESWTTVPSLIYPSNARRDDFYRESSINVERGDHIRLQDVNLTYDIRSKKTPRLFRDLKVTMYARNLGILWRLNKHGLDPDTRQLPLQRIWSLGLTANF
ncbi:SusC/RagA family TonB-linked outer membrane protein [Sphingobacterium shayense]|uniref:SusC/RagA family TonB-linked outer membrane protein n=1 Tax=Sphingobacterium shayense TaxID=626343 RepID=UPI001557E50D|nr:SusC/RagA family TonB-linked outer membrane protein [Sphingobacterium shayense]NQD69982.1 SusC/RagA family TonB-linked outer membrane protein [Sphingobacterium shayense]